MLNMIGGRKIDGYAVVFEVHENLPACGKWAIYPVTSNDGHARTIFHTADPLGDPAGYETAQMAATILAAALA